MISLWPSTPQHLHEPHVFQQCFLSVDRPQWPVHGCSRHKKLYYWGGFRKCSSEAYVASKNSTMPHSHVLFGGSRGCAPTSHMISGESEGNGRAHPILIQPPQPAKIIWEWGMFSRIVVVRSWWLPICHPKCCVSSLTHRSKVRHCFLNVSIVRVYAPKSDAEKEEVNKFYGHIPFECSIELASRTRCLWILWCQR